MQNILVEAALENGIEVDMDFKGVAGNYDPGEDSDSDDGWEVSQKNVRDTMGLLGRLVRLSFKCECKRK
jgi:hypothetical protein